MYYRPQYRLTQPDDALPLEILMLDFVRWNAGASGEGAAWFLPDWRERCAKSARDAIGRSLISTYGGRAVGYSTLFADTDKDDLYVTEGFRGAGIADHLFRLTLDAHRVAGEGIHRVSVFGWNAGARRFYEKMGGVEEGQRDDSVLIRFDL